MPTTVTFKQNFPHDQQPTIYQEAGLTFTNNIGNQWMDSAVNHFVCTYGSPSHVYVAPEPGDTFDFASCQFCNINRAIQAQPVTYYGTKSNGQQVTQGFMTPAGRTDIQTFAPQDFVDLVRLDIHSGSVAFDNLVFTPHGSKTVTFRAGFPAGCPFWRHRLPGIGA